MTTERIEISQEEVARLFEYKDGNLYRKVTTNYNAKAGDLVGVKQARGYLRVRACSKQYLVHRLIFLIHHGYMPGTIDHIDGDQSNNKIENLREATQQQNCYNRRLRSDNKSGSTNVYWKKQLQKWCVTLAIKGKTKHFGYFKDLELAELIASEARDIYRGKFNYIGV